MGVQNWRLFLVFFALYLAALLFALNFAPIDGFVLPKDGALRDLLSTHAMVNTIAINAIVIFYALTALRRAELALQTPVRPLRGAGRRGDAAVDRGAPEIRRRGADCRPDRDA